jgi:hypothetical protein
MFRLCYLGILLPLALGAGLPIVEYVVALILLWTLATVFLCASRLQTALYDDPGLIVFDYYPISDGDIFRRQWRRFLRGTWWTLLDFTAGYSLLLFHSGGGWHALSGGVVLGAVQWLFIVAMAVCLAAYARPKHIAFPGILFPAASFVFLLGGGGHPGLSAWLSNLAWCVPPTGWIVQGLGISNSGGLLHQIAPVVLSATLLALAPIAFRQARQTFLLSEPRHATDGRTPELIEFGEGQTRKADDIRAAIRGRQFLAGFDWQKAGFLERNVSRLFSARERVVAEFLLAANPRWTASFKAVLPFFLLVPLVFLLLGNRWVPHDGGAVWIVAVIVGANLLAYPRGFALPPQGGLQSAYYATYPVGFWELTRVLLKINFAKTIVCVLFLFVLWASAGGFQFLAFWNGLRLIALALIAQPLLVIAAISPNSNDTQNAEVVVLAVVLSLLMLAAGAVFFFATRWWLVAAAGILAAMVSIFGLLLYGRGFNGSRFDLVPLRRAEQE